MKWSVIYSFELDADTPLDNYEPTSGNWELTEDDDQFEGYDGIEEGIHKKYCAFLTDDEFRTFLDDVLYPSYVDNTGGMIGGMTEEGMTLGWMPAWSLSTDDDDAIYGNAYVCPFDETDEEAHFLRNMNENEVRDWIVREYI